MVTGLGHCWACSPGHQLCFMFIPMAMRWRLEMLQRNAPHSWANSRVFLRGRQTVWVTGGSERDNGQGRGPAHPFLTCHVRSPWVRLPKEQVFPVEKQTPTSQTPYLIMKEWRAPVWIREQLPCDLPCSPLPRLHQVQTQHVGRDSQAAMAHRFISGLI